MPSNYFVRNKPWTLLFVYIITCCSILPLHAQDCNNWLNVNSQNAYVRIGDLDVPGNKITVEAIFNRVAPWSNNADVWHGDLVSKHENASDCNYLLRPSSAEITTSNGYFKTPVICPIELNKTYHVAMVYDGSTLKFFRNGFLMSQIAATGNLYQNDWPTQIGYYFAAIHPERFIGYINEVRIWNVARTQDEIRQYMTQPLPNPQNTTGLLAYYTFNSLNNKQGNAGWNGVVGNGATINGTNPNCNFIVDSCNFIKNCPTNPPDFCFRQNSCSPELIEFNAEASDIKLYQWFFGNGSTASTAKATTSFSLQNNHSVKLKVLYDNNCWDSITKVVGVHTISSSTLTGNSDTTVCEKDSFVLRPSMQPLISCLKIGNTITIQNPTNYFIKPLSDLQYTYTANVPKTNLAKNPGFSDGTAHFGSDYILNTAGNTNGTYSVEMNPGSWNASFRNCSDHSTGTGQMLVVNGNDKIKERVWYQSVTVKPNTNYLFSVWLQSLSEINPARLQFSINKKSIGDVIAGNNLTCQWNQFYVIWNSGNQTNIEIAIINTNTSAAGNDFALDDLFFGEYEILYKTTSVKVAAIPTINLRKDPIICKGSTYQFNAVSNGNAINWSPGNLLNNSSIFDPTASPSNSTAFIATVFGANGCKNQDTVLLKVTDPPDISLNSSGEVCKGDVYQLAPIIKNALQVQWSPAQFLSDLNISQPIAKPLTSTEYTVTAENEGCHISKKINIVVKELPLINKIKDTLVCEGTTFSLYASGAQSYEWHPQALLDRPLSSTPTATVSQSTTFYVKAKGTNECHVTDSVKVEVRLKPVFSVLTGSSSICYGDSIIMRALGGDSYKWLPVANFSGSSSPEIKVAPLSTTVYTIEMEDKICNAIEVVRTEIRVNALPSITLSKSNDVDCSKTISQLSATGGSKFEWAPTEFLSNRFIAQPIAFPNTPTRFYVTVTSEEGCKAMDSILVNVNNTGNESFQIPNAFTPNNDGKNDCFGVRYWGRAEDFTLNIFNRWGEKVFFTKSPSDCWNGIYKGIQQPGGVYVYYITGKTFCGTITRKGTITLLR